MSFYKIIKKQIPYCRIDDLSDFLREMADENEGFENILVEYGIQAFIECYENATDMKKVVRFLKSEYISRVDCCGEDDEILTLPAKKAYKLAKKIYKCFK